MSLRHLMWHFVSVQTNENQGKTKTGSINREQWDWKYKNIKCHRQLVTKNDIILQYGIKNIKNGFVFFTLDTNIILDESTRLVARNDLRKITDFTNLDNTMHSIYEFLGAGVDQIFHRKKSRRYLTIYTQLRHDLWQI